MERKIISIDTCSVQNNMQTQCNWITTALLSDGSVWFKRDNDNIWHKLPAIPVPEDL